MQIRSNSLVDGERVPERFAFGKRGEDGRFAPSENVSPHVAWSGAPTGTRSYVLLMWDVDVPTSGEDVNQDGKTVPYELPRADFSHWILVDLPPALQELAEGTHGKGIVGGGKTAESAPNGRCGQNDYTGWFAGDPDMAGSYMGYDGPCPPWNDTRLHHYHLAVFALDVDRLDVDGAFTLEQVRQAMEGHVLAQAEMVCPYAIYADAKA